MILTSYFQFEEQEMIDNGVNPYIVDFEGKTMFEKFNLGSLSNLPSKKSVYFTTRPLVESNPDFDDPWFYKTGVFNGKFDSLIGQGASGTVISGEWAGKKAAFKFVEVGAQKFQEKADDALKTFNEKLSEMTSIQATKGSKIISFYGHYR